jgi:ZIP family zinc transporter
MVILYSLLPVVAMIAGAVLSSRYQFTYQWMSAFQHLAAGIVLAVASCEFVPSVMQYDGFIMPIVGFVVGMTLMLLIKVVSEIGRKQKKQNIAVLPLGLILAIAFDVFLDGMLMAVGFLSSVKAGQLITFALSVEICFLGVALVSTCRQYGLSQTRSLCWAVGVAMCAAVGFFISWWLLFLVDKNVLIAFESFGIAALLYLAVEELLVEAHDVIEDLPWMTAPFFIGFLFVMLFEKL